MSAHFDTEGRAFRKIVYCYGSQWQPIFEKFQETGVTFHEGLPESLENIFDKMDKPCLLIVDDLMSESQKKQLMENMATKGVHHEDNVKFKDSLAFLPFPLATFPKTFGLLELKKGFYPYFFDTPENQSYVDPLAPMEMFNPDGMSSKRREQFETWYNSLNDDEIEYEFNLQREREQYCASEVKLLKEGCMTSQF